MSRRTRVLCLHGQDQSAASLRAGTRLIGDGLEKYWEMHYLDAPFLVPDCDEDEAGEKEMDPWRRAAFQVSALVALQSDVDDFKARGLATPSSVAAALQEVTLALGSSDEGRDAMAAADKAGLEGVESMVSRKSARSLNRGWTVTVMPFEDSSTALMSGLGMSLGMLSDYIRETGTFHGALGYGSGADVAWLLQTMLSHPRSSAAAFPSFFPQLPRGSSRMPRMGGWEQEPPPANDVRLGDENLPSSFVPTQQPLEFLVSFCPQRTTTLDERTREFIKAKPPITAPRPGAFTSHSLELVEARPAPPPPTLSSFAPERTVIDASFPPDTLWSSFLAEWCALAVRSCNGDEGAARRIASLATPDSWASRL